MLRIIVLVLMASSAALASCASAQPGEERLREGSIVHAGVQRHYLLYEPEAIAGTPGRRPMVLALHGGGGTALGMVRLTRGRFNQLADEHGFYVVYPQGLGKSWNDGRSDPISYAHEKRIDDVGFLVALIERIESDYSIDASRVFATGISNGGLMSFRLGCDLPGRIRAIAPVTASIPASIADACRRTSGVGLVLFNGTADPLVPYDGGQIRAFGKDRGEVLSTSETIRIWVERNSCADLPEQRELADRSDDGTRVRTVAYRHCRSGAQVLLYRIDGGGHTWPGGRQYLGKWLIGRTSRDIDAGDEIWKFFSASF